MLPQQVKPLLPQMRLSTSSTPSSRLTARTPFGYLTIALSRLSASSKTTMVSISGSPRFVMVSTIPFSASASLLLPTHPKSVQAQSLSHSVTSPTTGLATVRVCPSSASTSVLQKRVRLASLLPSALTQSSFFPRQSRCLCRKVLRLSNNGGL